MLAGPTIVTHGTDEQRSRFLPDIVTGKKAWCQLFSEPGAGSDLAGLQAKAMRDGDEWIVNGQKVWTSGAQGADLGMLLARTDADVPKHRGITYFALDMMQPGIDIRPLREMTGRALFNEVFMTDCRVADADLIGGLNNGWAVANTTLANERAGLGAGGGGAFGGAFPGQKAGFLERRAGDFTRPDRAAGVMTARGASFLIDLAKGNGAAQDPTIRQDLMRLHTMNEIARYTNLRAKAAKAAGQAPGPAANTAKLSMSRITKLSRDLGPAHPRGRRSARRRQRPAGRHGHRDDPVRAGGVDLRRQRRDPEEHHRRAGAGPAVRAPPRQGPALQGSEGRHAARLKRAGRPDLPRSIWTRARA